MGRHNELTAVKARRRVVLPVDRADAAAGGRGRAGQLRGAGMVELQPPSSRRNCRATSALTHAQLRFNFAYASPDGWTWVGKELYRAPGRAVGVLGRGPRPGRRPAALDHRRRQRAVGAPRPLAAARRRHVRARRQRHRGSVPLPLRDAAMRWSRPRDADERGQARRRDDGVGTQGLPGAAPAHRQPAGMLAVDYRLKYAIPWPAWWWPSSARRSPSPTRAPAPPSGLAIALGTTLVYLTGVQIMKAVGGKDLVTPGRGGVVDEHRLHGDRGILPAAGENVAHGPEPRSLSGRSANGEAFASPSHWSGTTAR